MEGMITESIECTDFTCHFCPSWETRAGRSVGLKVLLSSCPELRQGFHSEQCTWISAGLNSLCYTSFMLCGFYMYIGNTFNRMGSFHRLPLHRSRSISWSARIHKGSKVAIQRTHIINAHPQIFSRERLLQACTSTLTAQNTNHRIEMAPALFIAQWLREVAG